MTPEELRKIAAEERQARAQIGNTLKVCVAAGCVSCQSDQVKKPAACAGAAAAATRPASSGATVAKAAAIEVRDLQRRRGRPGRVHGPQRAGERPAPRARGHGHRGLRGRAPTRATSTCAPSTRWRSSAEDGHPQAKRWAARQRHLRTRRSASTSTSASAPAPSSAARRPRSSPRSKAARQPAPAPAVSGRERACGAARR
jgi:hypothetical protein